MCMMLCHTLEMFWKDGAIKKSNSEAMKMLILFIYFAGTKLESPQMSTMVRVKVRG